MDIINANLIRMPMVSIIGFPALLTKNRISKQMIHMNLFVYELQGDLESDEPIIVSRQAQDDFCATVITPVPLLMKGVSQLVIDPGDITEDTASRCYTPAEFEARFYM